MSAKGLLIFVADLVAGLGVYHLVGGNSGRALDDGGEAGRSAAVGSMLGAVGPWAAAISDDGMRQEHLDRGVKRWMKDEPEAATEWLRSSEVLPEAERQNFLRPDADAEAEPGE